MIDGGARGIPGLFWAARDPPGPSPQVLANERLGSPIGGQKERAPKRPFREVDRTTVRSRSEAPTGERAELARSLETDRFEIVGVRDACLQLDVVVEERRLAEVEH